MNLEEIKNEIHSICYKGVRGLAIDTRRAEQLCKQYPELYAAISRQVKNESIEELKQQVRGIGE